jgi:hypothetical protein
MIMPSLIMFVKVAGPAVSAALGLKGCLHSY